MTFKVKDITGIDFDRLTVREFAGYSKAGRALWLCDCSCGNERVVRSDYLRSGHTQSCGCLRQERMKNKDNPRWNDGKSLSTDGYMRLHRPNHPSCDQKGYVREHRLVMEGKLGRYLKPWEIPHHKNEIKTDNDPDNLVLTTVNDHKRLYHTGD